MPGDTRLTVTPLRSKFMSKRLGEPVEPGLGGNDMDAVDRTRIGGQPADIDDSPCPPAFEMWDCSPAHQESAVECHAENVLPIG